MLRAVPTKNVAAAYAFDQLAWFTTDTAVWRAWKVDEDPREATTQHFAVHVSLNRDASKPTIGPGVLPPTPARLPQHPNIAQLLAHFHDDPVHLGLPGTATAFPATARGPLGSCLFMVLEPVDASLAALAAQRCHEAVDKESPLLEDLELLVVIEQAAKALQHLQKHKIVHRAITPDNILVRGILDGCSPGQVKLMGLERHWDAGRFAACGMGGHRGGGFVMSGRREMQSSVVSECDRAEIAATCAFAPEVRLALRDGNDVDWEMNDVWALGHSVYCAACWADRDNDPFPGAATDPEQLQRARYRELPPARHGPGFRTFVKALLDPAPHWRPSAEAASTQAAEHRAELGSVRNLVAQLGLDGGAVSAARATRAAAALRDMAAANGFSAGQMQIRTAIAEAHGIVPLVALLTADMCSAREQAAGALRNLSVNSTCQAALVDAGAIPLLVHLLQAGTPDEQASCAFAIRSLAKSGDGHYAQQLVDAGATKVLKMACIASHGVGELADSAKAALDMLPPLTPRGEQLGEGYLRALGPLWHPISS